MKKLILCFLCLFAGTSIYGQKSIKLNQQKTTFFYTQLNLHGGYLNDINGQRFDFTNRGPNNQFAFSFLKKIQQTQQKGYIKLINPVAYSIRFSVPFSKSINRNGQREADFKIKLLDTWVKFNTRWDRTNLWIGNRSIPYGHNPKLDPVSSFMTNLTVMDIGFVQDLGIFLKTPISSQYDLELSLTSGGMLNKPVLVCDQLLSDDQTAAKPTISLSDYKYENTWLLTGRVGNQSFNKNEMGVIAIAGRIANNLVPDDFVSIARIGTDWVYKYHEKFKFSNQVMFGISNSEQSPMHGSLNFQSSTDLFVIKRVILSSSFAANYQVNAQPDFYHLNYINANSLTYVFSQHTRLRLNSYYTKVVEVNEKQWGILLQFTTGFGQRS